MYAQAPTVKGVCLASLDPPETTAEALASPTAPQRSLHASNFAGWWRVQNALNGDGDAKLAKRARRINACGVGPMLVLTAKGRIAVSPGFCRDRMCPTCQHRRAQEVASRTATLIGSMDSPRFLTLTLRSMDRPLFLTLAALSAAFRVLRETKEWRRHVKGGVYVTEITRNPNTGLWHAHMHVVFQGQFWAQRDISKVWLRVTGDSQIVDVRAVHSRTSAANYLAKYVAKATDSEHWPDDATCEYADALHGVRMVHTFGDSYAVEVEPESPGEVKVMAEKLCTTNRVRHLANRGDAYGILAMELLRRAGWAMVRCLGPAPASSLGGTPRLEEWEEDLLVLALREISGRNPDEPIQSETRWDAAERKQRDVEHQQMGFVWVETPRFGNEQGAHFGSR